MRRGRPRSRSSRCVLQAAATSVRIRGPTESRRPECRDVKPANVMYEPESKQVKLCLPRIRKNSLIDIVPISSGCNSSCSYCCVRLAKGELFSYPESKIIKEVQDETEGALMSSKEGQQEMEAAVALIERVTAKFTGIASQVNNIVGQIEKIASSAADTASSAAEASASSEEQTAAVEELAASAATQSYLPAIRRYSPW